MQRETKCSNFPEKKEQNDSAIELDRREFGSGLEEFRWRSWLKLFTEKAY